MKKLPKSECLLGVVKELQEGGIVCFPTDTLYGLLGNPLIPGTLEKVFEIKKRDREKPLILLFPTVKRMEELGIEVLFKDIFSSLWPAPLTVVFPLKEESPLKDVLQRDDVAVRIPDDEVLLEVLKKVSPLFAPSANPQGLSPASCCKDCFNYFRDKVSLCVEGRCGKKPSTVVRVTPEKWEVLREGAFPVSKLKEVLPWKGK